MGWAGAARPPPPPGGGAASDAARGAAGPGPSVHAAVAGNNEAKVNLRKVKVNLLEEQIERKGGWRAALYVGDEVSARSTRGGRG